MALSSVVTKQYLREKLRLRAAWPLLIRAPSPFTFEFLILGRSG